MFSNKAVFKFMHLAHCCCILHALFIELTHLQPYSKSQLELESNLSEILPVNCNFICCFTPN